VGNSALESLCNQLKLEIITELRNELNQQTYVEPDRTMEVKEAAPYIGVKPQLLYKLCEEKRIPHWRAGVSGSRKPNICFSSRALDEWKKDEMRRNYNPIQ
jgi:excisionase family DNA binding protein